MAIAGIADGVGMSALFERDYERASPMLAARAQEESRRLLADRSRRPAEWMKTFKRFRGVQPDTLLEVRLTAGDRMFVHVDGDQLTYFRMGEHDLLIQKNSREIRSSLAKARLNVKQISDAWVPGGGQSFLPSNSGEAAGLRFMPEELGPEWAYYLSEDQVAVGERVLDNLLRSVEGQPSMDLVLGGPGTGKTSVLLWLFWQLSALEGEISIGLSISDGLATYLESSTGWDLGRFRSVASTNGGMDVLLVDDPGSLQSVTEAALRGTGVVAALDPLQLDQAVTDVEFIGFVQQHGAGRHWLTSCYRQKEAVGRVARRIMDVVASSSPFLDVRKKATFAKEHEVLTAQCNEVTFPNPTGFYRDYTESPERDWYEYVEWLKRLGDRGLLTTSWPALLLVVDEQVALPRVWTEALASVPYRLVGLRGIHEIKGLEFNHVAIVMGPELRDALEEGFQGSGRRQYDVYRLLRIPFTRARDSIAVFLSPGGR